MLVLGRGDGRDVRSDQVSMAPLPVSTAAGSARHATASDNAAIIAAPTRHTLRA